jgi:hypothetical protein
LIRGTRGGQEYWAIKQFTIAAYQKNIVSIQPQDFVPASSLLMSKEN